MKSIHNIKISRATIDDAEGIQNLTVESSRGMYKLCGWSQEDIDSHFNPEKIKEGAERLKESIKIFTDVDILFVAKDEENKIVGCCFANKDGEVNRVEALFVLEDFQGTGLAQKIYDSVYQLLNHTHDTFLDVFSGNSKAIKFYKKVGFSETGKKFFDERFVDSNGDKLEIMEMKLPGEKGEAKNNKYSYVSVLTTDDYLPGLIVLNDSLLKTKPVYGFLVLVSPNVSKQTLEKLKRLKIEYKVLEKDIHNPTDVNQDHRWFPTYSKLCIFDQTQFDKIVYLDVDMLVLKNIDELFDCPHMSGTNSPSMLSKKYHWTHLNTGIFVVEPSSELFEDMLTKIGKIENLESKGTLERPLCGSDQDFINAYYPDWFSNEKLHLDHTYNIFHYYLDEYNKECGYGFDEKELEIKNIHYASYIKPWTISKDSLENLRNDPNKELEYKAINMWLDIYKKYD